MGHFGEYVVATSHLIQLDGPQLAFYKLPSQQDLENPHVKLEILKKTHVGTLPLQLDGLHFFPRSPNCIVAIGLANDQQQTQENNLHIHFLTLSLEQHSPLCQVRTDFVYDVAGHLRSFHLAPCSPSSRSALGLLTVGAPLPAHAPSGRRIARVHRADQVYQLAVRVDFGIEGLTTPSIALNEVCLVADSTGKWAKVRAFDPYTGQVLLEEYEDSGGRPCNELVVADYVSP